jgi:hypothetical protein
VTDVGTWTFGGDGSATFTGPITFPAGIQPGTTKWGAVILGPGGAIASFPAVATGPTGATGTTGATGATGSTGATGATGTATVIGAADVVGTPANGNGLIYRPTAGSGSTPAAKWEFPKIGGVYSVSSFPSTSSASTAQRLLSSVTIPAQPWDWWPEVEGQCVVTNASDTRVDLIAYITNSSGNVVGRGYGAGNGAGIVTQVLQGAFGSDMPGGSSYGVISAGSSATIILRAENQVSSSNNWATGSGSFKVKVSPVP